MAILTVCANFVIPLVGLPYYFDIGRLRPFCVWAVFVRNFLIAVAKLFYFASLSLLSMTQGLAVLSTSPIFVLLITALLMLHRIEPIRIMAVGIGFSGIVLVLELDFAKLTWLGILPIFLVAFFMQQVLWRRSNYVKGKAPYRCFW